MIVTPWAFAVVVTGAGTAALAMMAATPEAGIIDPLKVRFCPLVPGNIAWDACDCHGQLALTIQRIVPATVYPSDASNLPNLGGCQPPILFAECLIAWNRCTFGLKNDGTAPTCGELFSSALLFQGAAYAMRRGVDEFLCEEKRQYRIRDFRIGAEIFPGPDGNCASVEMPFSFALSNNY